VTPACRLGAHYAACRPAGDATSRRARAACPSTAPNSGCGYSSLGDHRERIGRSASWISPLSPYSVLSSGSLARAPILGGAAPLAIAGLALLQRRLSRGDQARIVRRPGTLQIPRNPVAERLEERLLAAIPLRKRRGLNRRFESSRPHFGRWRNAGHRIPPWVRCDGEARNDRAVLTPALTRSPRGAAT